MAFRDIKPENILTNDDGARIILSDFGLATDELILRDLGCGERIK
jgi:serine/threonine protein kinase